MKCILTACAIVLCSMIPLSQAQTIEPRQNPPLVTIHIARVSTEKDALYAEAIHQTIHYYLRCGSGVSNACLRFHAGRDYKGHFYSIGVREQFVPTDAPEITDNKVQIGYDVIGECEPSLSTPCSKPNFSSI